MNSPTTPGRTYSAVVKTPPGQRRQATPASFAQPPIHNSGMLVPAMHSMSALQESARSNIPITSASLSAYSLKAISGYEVSSSIDSHRDSHGFAVPYLPTRTISSRAATPVNVSDVLRHILSPFADFIHIQPVISSPYSSASTTPIHRSSSRPEPFFKDYFALREEDAFTYGHQLPDTSSETSRAPSIELLDSLRLPVPAAIDLTTTSPSKKRKRAAKAKPSSTIDHAESDSASSSIVPPTNHPLSLSASQREREAAARKSSDNEHSDDDGDCKGDRSKKKRKPKARQCQWQPYEDRYAAEKMAEARQSQVAGQAGMKGTVYQAIATWCNGQNGMTGAEKTPGSVASRYQHVGSFSCFSLYSADHLPWTAEEQCLRGNRILTQQVRRGLG